MNTVSVDRTSPWLISTTEERPPTLEVALLKQTFVLSWNQFVHAEGAAMTSYALLSLVTTLSSRARVFRAAAGRERQQSFGSWRARQSRSFLFGCDAAHS